MLFRSSYLRSIYKLIVIITLFFICFWVMSYEQAAADDFMVIPYLAVKGEYNDNIFFDTTDEEEDFVTIISPMLTLHNRTEMVNLSLSARYDENIYSNNSKLDTSDQYYKAGLNYQLTAMNAFAIHAGYDKTSRLDRDIEVIDDETAATGLLMDASTRIRKNCSFSLNSTFSEKSAGSFSCSFSEEDFDDREDNDMRSHSVNAGFTRVLGFIDELTVGRFNCGYSKYRFFESEIVTSNIYAYFFGLPVWADNYFFDNSTQNYYFATLGVSRNMGEIFSMVFDVGGRYTESEYETRKRVVPVNDLFSFFEENIKEKNRATGSGLVVQTALSYNGERTNWSLNFSHDMKPSSGSSGASDRTSLAVDFSKRITYELSWNLSTGYYINKADPGEYSSTGEDESTLRVRSGIKYNFNKNLSIEGSYNFVRVEDDEDHTDKQRNLFFVRVSFKWF